MPNLEIAQTDAAQRYHINRAPNIYISLICILQQTYFTSDTPWHATTKKQKQTEHMGALRIAWLPAVVHVRLEHHME